jgi:hypothetical protein
MTKIMAKSPTEFIKYSRHCYYCPGCDNLHCIAIRPDTSDNGASWEFSGTFQCPTYYPSQLNTHSSFAGHGKPPQRHVCHTFITEGKIQFLSDCTHSLAGQTVDLPDIPQEYFSIL